MHPGALPQRTSLTSAPDAPRWFAVHSSHASANGGEEDAVVALPVENYLPELEVSALVVRRGGETRGTGPEAGRRAAGSVGRAGGTQSALAGREPPSDQRAPTRDHVSAGARGSYEHE